MKKELLFWTGIIRSFENVMFVAVGLSLATIIHGFTFAKMVTLVSFVSNIVLLSLLEYIITTVGTEIVGNGFDVKKRKETKNV